MSALVAYGSSDEEEDDIKRVTDPSQGLLPTELAASKPQAQSTANAPPRAPTSNASQTLGASHGEPVNSPTRSIAGPAPGPALAPDGPSLGPSRPALDANEPYSGSPSTRQLSPHSAYRAAMQSLTLPTVPDFSIPPSPPGSPPPGVDAKISKFMMLKRQGVHFNEKLAASSALKNPSLLAKLIENAGLDEYGRKGEERKEIAQYANTLGNEIWDVDKFPAWAYKEGLERARIQADAIREERKKGRKEVEFVNRRRDDTEPRKSRFDR